jgi:hypothetical protein
MSSARETVLMAQDLYERLGSAAIELAEVRSGALRDAGNTDGAQFWREVSKAMLLIATAPNTVRYATRSNAAGENPTWSLMQRIEGYRHLASEAEAVLKAISTAGAEMARIATGWRELAATLEQLAAAADEIRAPEVFSGDVYELN